MEKPTYLVTGANTGIGLATSEALARQGGRVLMVSRVRERGEAARQVVIGKTGNTAVQLFCADLSVQSDVRRLAEEVASATDRLDVLVNNAAFFCTDFQRTPDGFERQWAVNHLAPFLLTNLLLDLVKKSAPARIVNVSSKGNFKGTMHWKDHNLTQGYTGLKAYRQSKLANVLFTYELARRLEGTGVTANTLHPGVVGTQIGYANNNSLESWVWRLANPFMLSWEKGAETVVYLATSPEVAGVTGKYFVRCHDVPSAKASYDEAAAKRLWEVSEEHTGFKTS
jgi:NAD(P)-dependent dehydrogenase (short-subunit alcohol dehydrogenase family)